MMSDNNMDPEVLGNEVRRLVGELQAVGRIDILLRSITFPVLEELHIEAAKGRLSPLLITRDFRFILTSMNNREVDLQPVHKAVYLLFLAHPDGIEFKRLSEFRDELARYYRAIARNMDIEKIEEGVSRLVDPLDNAINEKCSRIKNVFYKIMDEYTASYYIISSHTKRHVSGTKRIWYERLKVINLPRNLVIFDN